MSDKYLQECNGLHNKELSLTSILLGGSTADIKCAGHVAQMEKIKKCNMLLVGK
jgi:hypothetical protein